MISKLCVNKSQCSSLTVVVPYDCRQRLRRLWRIEIACGVGNKWMGGGDGIAVNVGGFCS